MDCVRGSETLPFFFSNRCCLFSAAGVFVRYEPLFTMSF